jgi:hypothetical protein
MQPGAKAAPGLTTSKDPSKLLTDIASLKMLPTISNEQYRLAQISVSAMKSIVVPNISTFFCCSLIYMAIL